MAQIKIKSNPYIKNISYEYYDEDANKFIEINYKNYPNSKLVGEEYTNAFFVVCVGKILKAIYDSFFSKDKKICICFEGTKAEYRALQEVANEYEDTISIECGDYELPEEQETLKKLKEIIKSIGLNAELEEENSIYERINAIRNAFDNYFIKIKNELNDYELKFNNLKSEQETIVNDYIDAINKQKELLKEEIKDKNATKKEFDEFTNKHVADKKTLEMIYDELKNGVLNSNKESSNDMKDKPLICEKDSIEEELNYKNDSDSNSKIKGSIVKDVLNTGKKVIDSRLDVKIVKSVIGVTKDFVSKISEDVNANSKTDKLFMERINEMYNSSYNNIASDISGSYYKWLCEKEESLRDNIIDIISLNLGEKENEIIKNSIYSIGLTNRSVFAIENINDHKLDSIRVKFHLPGLPSVSGIRSEWSSELKRYVKKICNEFDRVKYETLGTWEDNIIKELSDNIIKMKPEVKEKIDSINELNLKIKSLQKKYEKAENCNNEIKSFISFN